ncbi:hypothetical protein LTR74_015110 [Friedmanniomyces endolithicus]|nr:hypothetical protein LTR74_015110 [Friedmanniomyces endolithicus]
MDTARSSALRCGLAALLCVSWTLPVAAQCEIPPLALAWTNTTVTSDGLGVTRGIEMGIGTPNQIFALRPYTALNNTRVNNVADCDSTSNDTCVGGEGGVFNSQSSPSYSVSIKGNWNGSQIDTEDSTGSYVYFNDRVSFQSAASVYGFPVVMDSEPQGGSFSGLPIGTNSSFLRAAVHGGVAPSQVVGLWAGSRSLTPVDGLMVLGGYDAARVNGNFTSFPVADASAALPCPLQVNITGLYFAGQSLLGDSQAMTACIEPYVQRFVFTPAVAQTFAQITAQNASLYKGMDYNASSTPPGNLTITLSNGYTTNITNDELFTLRRGSDQYGRYAITNNTVVEAGISDNRAKSPASQTPTLGGLFLTFNYLVMDYENDEFRLAPAVASDAQTGSSLTTVCTPTAPPSAIPSPTPAPPPANHTAAIAGGVVGGVVGLALIAAAIAFVLFRRRRRQRQDRTEIQPSMPEMESPVMSPRTMSDANTLRSPMSRWDSVEAPASEKK